MPDSQQYATVTHGPCSVSYDVVMLVLNDVAHDGRVRREAAALAHAGWRVLVLGTQRASGELPDNAVVMGFDVRRVRYWRVGARLWRPWRWVRHIIQAGQIVVALSRSRARVYHAHDLPALLLMAAAGIGLWRRGALVYDSHELYLWLPAFEHGSWRIWHRLTRPVFMCLEQFLIRRCAAVLTVSESLARTLARWYGVPRPTVVQNAVQRIPAPSSTANSAYPWQAALRRRFAQVIVHTGTLSNRERCLVELVSAFSTLPEDVALVFLGDGPDRGRLEQVAVAQGCRERVFFVEPVAPEAVAAAIQFADVAVALQRPGLWLTRVTLPNKLYEAVSAGLPLVGSDFGQIRRTICQYGLGPVCDPLSPPSIANALRHALAPAANARYREQVRRAQDVLNWDVQRRILVEVYRSWLD